MAEKNPTDRAERDPHTPTDDAEAEFIVLSFLIDEHPVQLKIFEVSRALNAASDAFGPRDAVERAIVALDGAGLLHCTSGFAIRLARRSIRRGSGTPMAYDPEFARRFGLNLRKARKRAGLSQEEVGFRASLHRTEAGLLERGERGSGRSVPRHRMRRRRAGRRVAADARLGGGGGAAMTPAEGAAGTSSPGGCWRLG